MELFTAAGKLKKFFFPPPTRDVRCVHHGWHGTHRYDIQVLATHTSTWVHRYTSAMICGFRSARSCRRVLCVLCTKCTLHINHILTHVIFQHTKQQLLQGGCFLTTYARIVWWQKCELQWKTAYWGKNFWIVPSICTGFVNTCPTVFL